MILVILVCTLIGYLVGSALIGLGAGVVLFALTVWADTPYTGRHVRTSRRARRRLRKRAGR